jgi:RNase P/RNase MRP subunit p29
MNYKFIEKSKELHQLLKELKGSVDNETVNMITVTERQYRKIAKVNKDDMKLYLWLSSNATIPTDIRTYYNDPKAPVMHKKR